MQDRRGQDRWIANAHSGDVDGPGERVEHEGGRVDEVEHDNDAHSGEQHEVDEQLLHRAQYLKSRAMLSQLVYEYM